MGNNGNINYVKLICQRNILFLLLLLLPTPSLFFFFIHLFIIVVNLTRYFNNYSPTIFGERIHHILNSSINRDASYGMLYYPEGNDAMDCINAIFTVGVMQTDTDGCIASSIITILIFSVVVTTMAIRFIIALLFQWFISRRLVKPGGRSNWLWAWRSVQGGNSNPDNHIRNPIITYYSSHLPASPPFQQQHILSSSTHPSSSIYQLPTYHNNNNNPTNRTSTLFNTSQSNIHLHPSSISIHNHSTHRLSAPIPSHHYPSSSSSANPSLSNINTNNNSNILQIPSSPNLLLPDSSIHLRPTSVPSTFRPSQQLANTPSSIHSRITPSHIGSHSSLSISNHSTNSTTNSENNNTNNSSIVETELYTCMLVTCYSEGEDGLKTTLDSLAETTYSNKRKVKINK